MASGPITSWQIDGETMETVADFIFLGSQITADGDCSHEIKRRLLLGRKVMTNLREFQKNIYFFFIDYAKAFDYVDHNKLWKNSERDGNTGPPDWPLEKPICRSASNS